MKLDAKELRFDGENGRDEFNRAKVADRVIRLLTSDIDISPMVIDGDWGTGKTEFCHKLIYKFRSEHDSYQILYVDAFQADHANDPLMTILAGVASLIPEGEKKEGFFKHAIPVARYGVKTVLKAGIGHLLRENADDIADGLEDQLQEAANKAIDASVAAVLKDHEKATQNLKALQTTLAELANESPIVIFIDELDRCRPDFAVHMLEVIKHTFDVENVKFVLVTNTRQLRAAINHSYGSTVDAQRYLDKFLKFSIKLPTEVNGRSGYTERRLLASVEHFVNLVSSSTVLSGTELDNTGWATFGFASQLIRENSLSLREVETFTRHLEIYQSLSQMLDEKVIWGYQLLSIVGTLIFSLRNDIYDQVQGNITNAEDIAKLFGIERLPDYQEFQSCGEHVIGIGVMLAQRSAIKAENFIPVDETTKECWRTDFQRYFKSHRIPGDVWEPIKDVFSVLSLSGQRR
jgi:hypothetical protein